MFSDLDEIVDLLRRCDFPQTRWQELGLMLGLHMFLLDSIQRNHCGYVFHCLTECLSLWLRRAESRGGATWNLLSTALRSMNENSVADKFDKESESI